MTTPALEWGLPGHDLADIAGQPLARMALETCAAGGHNLFLLEPPESAPAGRQKTSMLLAEQMPAILPRLDSEAAMAVTLMAKASGSVPENTRGWLVVPPLLTPPSNADMARMLGGGPDFTRPGSVSRAHKGVLYLEDAPDFSLHVLNALRRPIDTGEVILERAGTGLVRFPAKFMLMLSARPCPCPDPGAGCACTPAAKRKYLERVFGQLGDLIDVRASLEPDDSEHAGIGESTATAAARVLEARERAALRLRDTPWTLNSEVSAGELRGQFAPASDAVTDLERAVVVGQVNNAGASRIIRVAWSLADLAGKQRPQAPEIKTALKLRLAIPGGGSGTQPGHGAAPAPSRTARQGPAARQKRVQRRTP